LTELADGVHYLGTVGKPEVLSTYLVGGGSEYALLEPGPSNTVDQTLSLIRSSGVSLDSIRHLVVTHVHLDHAGGAWKMIDSLPNADVIVYKGGGKHTADPQRLSQGAEMVLGPLYRLWGEMKAMPADRIQEVVDGDILPVGGHHLKVLHTPGHSPFHMSLMDLESRSLFTGDAVGMYVGENEVGGESWALTDIDPSVPLYLHIQAICEATLGSRQGIGVLEQLAIGPHQPSGFKDLMDMAP
jgi:glyoxylase-like metal-dependent hydrolase (beta-lactamase superfamily II)